MPHKPTKTPVKLINDIRASGLILLLALMSCAPRPASPPFIGRESAPIVLDYFMSPFCYPSLETVRRLLPKLNERAVLTGKVRLNLRLVALTYEEHELSLLPAIQCAGHSKLGFLPYLQEVADAQMESRTVDPLVLAESLGIPREELEACREAMSTYKELDESVALVAARKVTGIPALYWGEKELSTISPERVLQELNLQADAQQ